jgi:hypothetical protein
MSHAYEQFEGTPLWESINKGLDDFAENNDTEETTSREYIVGYLYKLINESVAKDK